MQAKWDAAFRAMAVNVALLFFEIERMSGEVVAATMTSCRRFLGPRVLFKLVEDRKGGVEVFIKHPDDRLRAADINRSGRCIR